VGVKIKFKSGQWIQLTGYSPKSRYPVFATTPDDRGFRVVSCGSAFPLRATDHSKAFYVTNRHVVANGEELVKEGQRFYAALRLAAEKTANGKDIETRFRELTGILNLPLRKDPTPQEKSTYLTTIDAVWDVYDNFLSLRADPGRILFQKYVNQVPIEGEIGYFLHQAGPATDQAIQATVFKLAKPEEPDLAILSSRPNNIQPLELDPLPPTEGEEIQVIGYPTASDQIDLDASKYFAPTFTSGRISRVALRMLQVDAPVTYGSSGSPVISERGKVLGAVAARAKSADGAELSNFTGVVAASSIKSFAPELFDL
jgi:S1-C subfamily serine protease